MAAATVPSCSSVMTNGGEIWSATPRSARAITPRSSVSAATRSADFAVELDGREQTNRPHLAHEVVTLERPQRCVQHRLQVAHPLDETLGLEHVDVRERDRARGGMARVRVAVAQELRSALPPERLGDAAARDDGAERYVAGRDALRDRDQVRTDAEALAAEPLAEAPEARDHLVGDQQDLFALQISATRSGNQVAAAARLPHRRRARRRRRPRARRRGLRSSRRERRRRPTAPARRRSRVARTAPRSRGSRRATCRTRSRRGRRGCARR